MRSTWSLVVGVIAAHDEIIKKWWHPTASGENGYHRAIEFDSFEKGSDECRKEVS
jgi:hypothetical protein